MRIGNATQCKSHTFLKRQKINQCRFRMKKMSAFALRFMSFCHHMVQERQPHQHSGKTVCICFAFLSSFANTWIKDGFSWTLDSYDLTTQNPTKDD